MQTIERASLRSVPLGGRWNLDGRARLDSSIERLSTAWPAQRNSIRSGLPIHIDPMEKSVQTSSN